MQAYVELYGGWDAKIYEKYAFLMANIFIAFTHGLSMPIIFPIVLVNIIVLYVTEKLQYTYFYK